MPYNTASVVIWALQLPWAPLSTWHLTCVIIHAACMNYGQYHACRCLVQRLHPAMGRHGIVLRTCKNPTIYMTFDRCYHPCRMHEFGQYCVCRCLVQRLHPAMGRHGIALLFVGWALRLTCRIMHAAYREWVNTVLAYVWCILLWRHNGRDGV